MIGKKTICRLAALLASFSQKSIAMSANIQASPSLVGAEPALLSVMLETEYTVPSGGGFRISLPTQFDSEAFDCKLLEPQTVSMASCTIENSTGDAIMVLSGQIGAFEQVYLEVDGAQNPQSTSLNKDFGVSSFD